MSQDFTTQELYAIAGGAFPDEDVVVHVQGTYFGHVTRAYLDDDGGIVLEAEDWINNLINSKEGN